MGRWAQGGLSNSQGGDGKAPPQPGGAPSKAAPGAPGGFSFAPAPAGPGGFSFNLTL